MAHHKSTIKRIKTDAKRRLRNNGFKSKMKTHIKKVLESKVKEEAEVLFRQTVKMIDQIASKKIIHKKRAASHKSKLALYVNSLS
ncbi:MAG: 30S ribosomal protein S20 [Candidatus Marinimicrobia bacterium]|nr:30S ribosomal protein S20 [Candidatus Neomarinimicrobiota bacterium]